MMRPIKFRAWIKTGNETDDYVKPMTIQQMIHSKESTFSLEQLNDLVDFEQFTGLKDANGKEIYEGDIIVSKPNEPTFEPLKIGVVKRSKIDAGWSYRTATDEYNIWTSGKYRTYEVIGNVHTNSELLEENKMKYIEAEKQIEALSSKYSVDELWGYFAVNYKGTEIACVGSNERYVYDIRNKHHFQKLPFSNKLYMILSELAMTQLDERKDEKKYFVKAFGETLNINDLGTAMLLFENKFKTKFTLKEIEQLKQRDDIPLDWDKVELEEEK